MAQQAPNLIQRCEQKTFGGMQVFFKDFWGVCLDLDVLQRIVTDSWEKRWLIIAPQVLNICTTFQKHFSHSARLEATKDPAVGR